MRRAALALLVLYALVNSAVAQQIFWNAVPTYSGSTAALSTTGYSFESGNLFALPAASLNFPLPFSVSYGVKGNVFGGLPSTVIDTRAGQTTNGFFDGVCIASGCPAAFAVGAGTNGTINGTGAGQVVTRAAAVNDGNWHSVCLRETAGGAYLYVDGLPVSHNPAAVTFTPSPTYWRVALPNIQVAFLRDIRVYNVDISSGGCNILGRLANGNLTPSSGVLQNNLAAHWLMTNCTGTGCADSSGNGNNLIYDSAAPVCSISSPANGFTNLSGSVNLQATCTDAIGVTGVDWFVDGAWQGHSATSPFTTPWDTTTFIDGTHSVLIQAANAASTMGVQTSTGTTSNSVAAKTIYLDPTSGTDCPTHNGLSTSTPCSTLVGVQSIVGSTPLHGGDSILQKAGTNLNINDLTTSVLNLVGPSCTDLCPTTQNVYPGKTITFGTYGGSGNCHTLAGVMTDCASVTLASNGTVPRGTGILNFFNIPNLVVQNIRLFGNQPNAIACPTGTAGGCNTLFNYVTGSIFEGAGFYNGSSVSTMSVQNNEFEGAFHPLYMSAWLDPGHETTPGFLCGASAADNYVHGQTITSAVDIGIYTEGGNCTYNLASNVLSVAVNSNYVANIGGRPGNISGSAINMTNGGKVLVDNFNATGQGGANITACGSGYGNWWYQVQGVTAKGNESYNQFPTSGSPNKPCDNGAFDLDLGVSFGVMEFDYGHTTWGPLVGVYGVAAGIFQAGSNTVAYNIFENGDMGAPNDGTSAMTAPSTGFAGPVNWYNNTLWNGYNGTNRTIPDFALIRVADMGYGQACSGANGWINPIVNGINVATTFPGLNTADFISGGFSGATQNCTTLTHKNNDYFPIGGGVPTFFKTINGTTHTGLTDWNAVSGDTGVTIDPNFAGAGGAGVTCYSGSGIPVAPGTLPCPTNYALQTGNALIGTGLDLTATPYFLTLPATDYYTTAIPNGTGTGFNYGADGAHH